MTVTREMENLSCEVCKEGKQLYNGVMVQTCINSHGELEIYYMNDDQIEVAKHKVNFCPNCGADLRVSHKISKVLEERIYEFGKENLTKQKCMDIIEGRIDAEEEIVKVAKFYLSMLQADN